MSQPLAAPIDLSAVAMLRDLEYARHDGVSLKGHLWKPAGQGVHRVIVAIHGGGWQAGSPDSFQYLGPWLAAHGCAVFAIGYRFSTPGRKAWPECFLDARAAVQFEARVAGLIASGAGDRATAIRWIADAEGAEGDAEYLCFLLGLEYDYFAGDFF